MCRRHEWRGRLKSRAIASILLIGNVPDSEEENEMSELRKRMNEAMVLRGFAERTRESYLACVIGLAKHYRTIARHPRWGGDPGLPAAPDHREEARLLQRQSGGLRDPLSLRGRARAKEAGLRDPDGQGAQAPAADPHARRGGAPVRPLPGRTFAHAADDHLRRRTAPVRSLRPATGRHRIGTRAHVSQGAPGQGRQGSLHAALAPAARSAAPVLAGRAPAPVVVPERQR